MPLTIGPASIRLKASPFGRKDEHLRSLFFAAQAVPVHGDTISFEYKDEHGVSKLLVGRVTGVHHHATADLGGSYVVVHIEEHTEV